tara:strand:+ start:672 stop:1127 length:456 start_codon:yes stop_codon:yes gene_type:complete
MENKDDEFEEVRFDQLNFSDLEETNYHFRDPIVKQVVDQFVSRSDVGYNKYGQTLDSERRQGVKNLGEYLQDVQEELMDAILYIQAAKEELADKPYCKCEVKDVEPRAKTTIGDLEALRELREKMLLKKMNDDKEQVILDKDNFGYVSNNT